MKKIALICMAVFLMLLVFSCSEKKTTEPIIPPEIGDIIRFGAYNWRVLEVQDDKALIISKNILEIRAYHDEADTSICWDECSMRTYLNEVFYNSNAFSKADRKRITPVTNENLGNRYWGTPGGPPTLDKIFLLSESEALRYFINNTDRVANFNGKASKWLLRTPGDKGYRVCCIEPEGYYYTTGFFAFISNGVRPALWISL